MELLPENQSNGSSFEDQDGLINDLRELTPIELRFGAEFGIANAIMREGPGDGYASYPWALDHYERDLGLRPIETWLLKRMMKVVWVFGEPAYLSMRKISREAMISTSTLSKITKSLMRKGFFLNQGRGEKFDRRVRHDISGIFFALFYCIGNDPDSKSYKMIKRPLDRTTFLGANSLEFIKQVLPSDSKMNVGNINESLNKAGYWIWWGDRKIRELEDGAARPEKLSTEEIKTLIYGSIEDDDFAV